MLEKKPTPTDRSVPIAVPDFGPKSVMEHSHFSQSQVTMGADKQNDHDDLPVGLSRRSSFFRKQVNCVTPELKIAHTLQPARWWSLFWVDIKYTMPKLLT